MSISVVILSFNAERVLAQTINQASLVSDDIHVLDSFSSDSSVAVAEALGAKVLQRQFSNYGEQRNWAIQNLPLKNQWQLHLDADERLSGELVDEINRLKPTLGLGASGYLVSRRTFFMGRALRFGGYFPIWHLRLFRGDIGRCEQRLYDQHFIVDGPVQKLKGELWDANEISLSDWTSRHNRWSDLEVDEYFNNLTEGRVSASLRGNAIQKKRALRALYGRLPLFIRPWLFFVYRYFCRLGFLDGYPGLIYCVLQTLWFRFLIDAKVYERLKTQSKGKS